MFYTYIIKSLKNGRYYTGSTSDFDRRFEEHNSGQSTYTKLAKPFQLVYLGEFESRLEAIRQERYLKGGKGREWFKGIIDQLGAISSVG